MRISFYNDTDIPIVENYYTSEKDIPKHDITYLLLLGVNPLEITSDWFYSQIKLAGYHDQNILLYIIAKDTIYNHT
jgi:hypothetical protein